MDPGRIPAVFSGRLTPEVAPPRRVRLGVPKQDSAPA